MQIPLTLPGPPDGLWVAYFLISRAASAIDRMRAPVLPFAAFLGNVWGVNVLMVMIALAMIVLCLALSGRPMARYAAVFFCTSAEMVLVTGLLTGEWVRASVDARFMLPSLGQMVLVMAWTALKLVRGQKTEH